MFSLEEMECDNALIAHCRNCGEPLSLTISLETLRRWWLRFDSGEEEQKPPVPKNQLSSLFKIEDSSTAWCDWGKIEIHLKHFRDYKYIEFPSENTLANNSERSE